MCTRSSHINSPHPITPHGNKRERIPKGQSKMGNPEKKNNRRYTRHRQTNKNTSQMCWTPSCTSKHSILMYIDNNTNIKIRIRWYISHSNITSFFRFVNKRAIYRLGIISLAHASGHVTDIPVVNVHVDELSSARNWQHKLCATLSSSVIINYRLPIWFKHILFAN